MTRRRVTALTLLIMLTAPYVAANTDNDPRRITVNGHAQIRVVPDEVVVSLGVETVDVELSHAKSSNDSRMVAVIAAAEKLGIAREHIATEYVGVEPVYRYDDGKRHFLHYRVRKTTVITLRDVDKFEALLSSALEAGANYVHSIDFRTTKLREHRDRARALAIVAAKEKAEALATELEESVDRVHTIREGYAPAWSSYGSWWGRSGGGRMSQNVVQNVGSGSESDAGPTTPGQIAIDASVTVTFQLSE